MDIHQLLKITQEKNASDLHLLTNYPPSIRINNILYPLREFSPLVKEDMEKMIYSILTPPQKELLINNKELDLSYENLNARFRVNVYYTKNNLAAAFRFVPTVIKSYEELNIVPTLRTFTQYHQGLVLITGPTGEGKSTTLATMINDINQNYAKHIITVEDPIEFVYPSGKSIISQREMHHDTYSFNVALRSVLREDPDVVLVGEMRDYDTIQSALTIAETGHLVFSTLHTRSTPEAIDRIIDVFPSNQQNQVRNQLASLLIAIVAQRLLPTIDELTRIPCFEILINNSAVGSTIREGKNFMIDNILETNEASNMRLFEKSLVDLYRQQLITQETAISYALRPSVIKKLLK